MPPGLGRIDNAHRCDQKVRHGRPSAPGLLVGFLFAAGCSNQPTSGNKLDDPELKAYMKKTTDQFKAKMQEKKTNNPNKGSSK